ncbi:hypothetical protein SLEP1_g50584 [Rubroshorea leprosula]|uniref:Wall-associated receptor kinase C-terminal domain-containing protein n=1 Tax=Rubroshorea leprosula TaxID=152421 RepID=A0AAV5M0L2_9ROSI|nr:hypothetical protein SLEP1_g50584 [Rubroshorea leprosula]
MELFPQPIFSSAFVCIIAITIFSILLLLPPSYSDPLDEFFECNRSDFFDCGRLGPFRYPFWNDSTPKYCRSLGLHLTNCEMYPTIDFGPDNSFLLLHRNLSNYILTIAPTDIDSYICREITQHQTLSHPYLKLSETNKILTLFYGCPPPTEVPYDNKNLECEPGPKTPFYMNDSETNDHYKEHHKCGTVKVAINQMGFNILEKKMGLKFALSHGFDVEYNISADLCDRCENLDGICEISSNSVQYLQTTCRRRPATLLLLLVLFPSTTCGVDERFSSCSSSVKFGKLSSIGYPSWKNDQPDYCGQPGFKLEDCKQEDITITILPRMYHLHLNDKKATILYDCAAASDPNKQSKDQFRCPVDKILRDAYFVSPNTRLGNEEFRRSCNISAVIPVMKTAVKRFVNHGLSVGEVVNQGFEVKRNVEAEQCRSCLKTGGSCGFNSTFNQFRCFCDGGDFCPSRMPVVPASQFDTPGAPPVPDPIPTPAMCFVP